MFPINFNKDRQYDSKLTGHGCLCDGQEERDGEGEGHVADDVWVEQRAGEHQHRGRQVDQVVGAQRHHQPASAHGHTPLWQAFWRIYL